MRLRIHAVHADDPHMRICASRCACKNLDAHQPHTGAKNTTFPHLIPPSIYGVMYVLELDLAVESASHQYEWGNELSNHHFLGLSFYTVCICATSLHCGWAYGSSEFHFNQWFFTLGTRVGLLPSVHKQMSAQCSSFTECLFALCSSTLCLFPTVLHKFSSSCECEWLFALCTSVGILPSVNRNMSAQISSLAELLFAFCALVWFLSTVGEQMSGKIGFCDWGEVAQIALNRLLQGVCLDVNS